MYRKDNKDDVEENWSRFDAFHQLHIRARAEYLYIWGFFGFQKKREEEKERNSDWLYVVASSYSFYMNFFLEGASYSCKSTSFASFKFDDQYVHTHVNVSRFLLSTKFFSKYLSQRHSIIEIMQFVQIAFIVCYMLNYWIATALCTYTRIVINFNHNFLAVMFNLLIACSAFFWASFCFLWWRKLYEMGGIFILARSFHDIEI